MDYPTLEEQTQSFFHSWRAIEQLYDQYAKSVGLTFLGLNVLSAIYETPENCTQKLICEKTHLPKQSVNSIIRAFWEQGYVELKELDRDRRNKAIRFSEAGREYADRIIGRLIRKEAAVLAELTHRQRQDMIALVKQMAAGLEELVCAESPQEV